MPKLLVCEKHMQAEYYQPFLEEGDAIILCPTVVSYVFDYPSSLKFSELPYVNEMPRYKDNPNQYNEDSKTWFLGQYTKLFNQSECNVSPLLLKYYRAKGNKNSGFVDDKDFQHIKEKLYKFMASFDEIIYACDVDHTGLRGFDFMMKKHYEISSLKEFSKEHSIKITAALNYGGNDKKSLERALSKRMDFFESAYIKQLRTIYLKKDFFEYNYNLNSLLLVNKAYFLATGSYPGHTITKNFILTLFLLKESSLNFQELYTKFAHMEIGHPASRHDLTIKLKEMKLIIQDNEEFQITELGCSFLSNLHRKMNDPHLGRRLYNDYYHSKLTLKEFNEKYQRYLSTTFNKQKRYINKLT